MQSDRTTFSSLTRDRIIDPYPLTVPPETPLSEAVVLLAQARSRQSLESNEPQYSAPPDELNQWPMCELSGWYSYVLIVEGYKVVGIFTERDLVRLIASGIDLVNVSLNDVMTHPVTTILQTDVNDAFLVLERMRKAHIRHLPVVDDQERLVGVITHDRIRQALQPLNFLKLKRVSDVMSTNVICASVAGSVIQLAQLMAEHQVSCVVIVDEDVQTTLNSLNTSQVTPVGIVTERDIVQFQALGENLAQLQTEAAMSAPLFLVHPQDSLWTVREQMQARHVRRFVVAGSDRELLGIVTQTNVLQILDPTVMLTELEHLHGLLNYQTSELRQANRELLRKSEAQERLAQILQLTNQTLEERVESRTQELLHMNGLLQEEIAARQQSEQLLRAIYDRALEAIAIVNDAGQCLDANPVACDLFGYSYDGMKGYCLLESLGPGEGFELNWPIPVNEREQGVLRLVRSDGQVRDVECVAIANFFPHHHLLILQDITERKRAEVALRTSETRYRGIVEEQTELVIRCSPDYVITFVNDAFCQFRGELAETLIGENIFANIYPKDRAKVQANFDSLTPKRPVTYTENRRTNADGEIRWHHWTERGIFDSRGHLLEIQSVARDITERKLAQEELQRQYDRSQLLSEVTQKIRQELQLDDILNTAVTEVRNLLNADRILIVRLNRDRSEVVVAESVSQEWPAMLGHILPPDILLHEYHLQSNLKTVLVDDNLANAEIEPPMRDSLQGMGVMARLVVPVRIDRDVWGLLVAHQCLAPREWKDFEVELLQQLAVPIGIAISQAELLENLEQLVTQRTSALEQTNTELEREIEERKQTEIALHRSRKQLRLITDALPILIAYLDREGRYLFVNRLYESWFGLPPSSIVGRQLQDLVSEESYQQSRPHIETVLSGQDAVHEKEILHRDGSWRWVRVTYIPHIDAQGAIRGFFSMIEDISDRKETERMKNEFVSVVSHELRTPLTSIHGSIKLLATGQLGTIFEDGQEMLEIADKNCDRLVRLVNDILDLQRMDSGRIQFEKHECNVASLLNQSANSMLVMAKEHEITLLVEASDSIQVVVDSDAIVQTLTNLLSNAIKFSIPGGIVSLSASRQEGNVIFQVQDEGEGIPVEKLENIFERFSQVDATDSRRKGGTGLGLAICKGIVQLHNGKIWAESVLGQGSTFYISLPVSRIN